MTPNAVGRQKTDVVTVRYKDVQTGEERAVKETYERKDVENVDELLTRLQENSADVIKAYNYGLDLFIRQDVRKRVEARVAGPGKALANLAAGLIKVYASIGQTLSEEEAMRMAKAQLAAAQK